LGIDGISIACYYNSKGMDDILMNRLRRAERSKMIKPGGPEKKTRDQIKNNKKNARIGFLESLGDSGYDNRTDPNYCFDVLRNFVNKEESEGEALG
jgi:hypothetical protein